MKYLEFKDAECKDCYKCLRECPVKAIEYINQKAQIIEDRCILCGKCTIVCPQNAKHVHSELDMVEELLRSDKKVIASVAPSCISSFKLKDFETMRIALKKMGFDDAEETAIGAKVVSERYTELLKTGEYDNFITSACPAVNNLIELYYPKALPFLARVDSPMIAHAKIIKAKDSNVEVVFIGPCIAKKKEGYESGIVANVLTFDEIQEVFREKNIDLKEIAKTAGKMSYRNKARIYPISRGIIKSFNNDASGQSKYPEKNYEYIAVDGVQRCVEVLENIETYSGMFLELNACEYACVNGPCSLMPKGGAVKSNGEIREYVNRTSELDKFIELPKVDISKLYPKLETGSREVSESEITEILHKTGKYTKEDELNCGACGYNSCREKAWAVANGYAEVEMCVPYMRKLAETKSYEIIRNSPNGIALMDYDLKLQDMNNKAKEIWGVNDRNIVGEDLVKYCDPTPMIMAVANGQNVNGKRIKIQKTNKTVDMSVTLIREHRILFIIMRDITDIVESSENLRKVKLKTIQTTDNVIKKQMRVAQEIASLLGETTAESKVALLKLKSTLEEDGNEEEE